MRIGIFDSGLGGINVLKELINKYPYHHYIYYGDTLNLPYGNKNYDELLNLSRKIISFLEKKDADLIIIACGTISSNCYKVLKEECSLPIYDIISPTLDYLKTLKGNIGVIGTIKTIDSNIFSINGNVFSLKTPEFVPIIENNKINEEKDFINNKINSLKEINYLVLGCTHYPLLKNVINNKNIELIDMGKCLTNKLDLSNNKESLQINLYFSKLNKDYEKIIMNILKREFTIREI